MTASRLDCITSANSLVEKARRHALGVIELSTRVPSMRTLVFRAMNEQFSRRQVKDMACVAIHFNSNRTFCSGSDVKAKDYGRELNRKIVLDRGNAVTTRDREITKEAGENVIGFSPRRRFRTGYDRDGLPKSHKAPL